MGTRNLTCIVHNGEFKVAQYCQWDGYPSGQGTTILGFLHDLKDRDTFIRKCDECIPLSEEQIKERWESIGSVNGMATMEQSDAFKQKWPQLQRDMGADILEYIDKANGPAEVFLDTNFAGDGLFCEWCYVIDFDKNTFEVYRGFCKKDDMREGRFSAYEKEGEYAPVQLFKTYLLDALPSMKEFLKIEKEV
jgi:hypothetical protein